MKTIQESAAILDLDMAIVAIDLALANDGAKAGDYRHPSAQAELADLDQPQLAELGRRVMHRSETHG